MVLPVDSTVARQKGAKQGGGTGVDRENSNYSESPKKRYQATFYMTEKLTQGGTPQRYLPQKVPGLPCPMEMSLISAESLV